MNGDELRVVRVKPHFLTRCGQKCILPLCNRKGAQVVTRGMTQLDRFVGGRIKQRRKALKMSQGELGKQLGVTFQQVQKYERGANRVSAGALYKIAAALDVPITYFYDGLPALVNGQDAAASRRAIEFLCTAEGARMVEALGKVSKTMRIELANHVAMVARVAGR